MIPDPLGSLFDDEDVPPEYRMPTPQEALQKKLERFKGGTAHIREASMRQARHWPIVVDIRETEENHILGAGVSEIHLCCGKCNQSVTILMTAGTKYRTTDYDIHHGICRHILQAHESEARDGSAK